MKNILPLLLLLFTLFTFSQTTPGKYTVDNLSSNTINSDFGTAFYGEDKIIFSSASKEQRLFKSKALWKNNQTFLDLYEGVVEDDGNITDVKPFSNKLNTKVHEASVAFTPDQTEVYFTRNYYYKRKLGKDKKGTTNIALYKAYVSSKGKWTDVISMPFNNMKYSVGSPTVSKDGKKLYFASDMPGGLGLTDIYVVDIYGNNKYGIPKNLGSKINTSGHENFPYIDNENILYYSSDSKKDGLGGLDVYANKIYETKISNALHLGAPVNSEADDFAYILKNDTNEGYFSSNRSTGKGDDDIYHFKASPPLKIECNQIVNGIVKNKESGDLIIGAIVVLFDEEDKEVATETTDEKGIFNFTVDCKKKYKIVASKAKFENDDKNFTVTEIPDIKLNFELTLNPIPVIVEVVEPDVVVVRERVVVNINPIYFDFDKSNIRSDAAIELDKVVAVMQRYPSLMIEAGSHTDVRGSDIYNLNLSTRRAKSTIAYIISKGVDASRITARGYGETQLVNHCNGSVKCSEADHQQNRRTEFVILNPDVLGYN